MSFQAKGVYIPPPEPIVIGDVEYSIFSKSNENFSSGFFKIGNEEEIELLAVQYNDELEMDVQGVRPTKLELSDDKTCLYIKFTSSTYDFFYHLERKLLIAFPCSSRWFGIMIEQYRKEYRLEFKLTCVFKNDSVELWFREEILKFGKVKELDGKVKLLEKKLSDLKVGTVNVLVKELQVDYIKKELIIETPDGLFVLDEKKSISKRN